ncbi:MAG: ATP-binding protein [Campylobacterota bacterium]|nr:ATP-binding protein [Campylobacterota bacterium]
MLKIHHHFFFNFIALFIGTILVAALIGYLTLKSLMIGHSEDELQRALNILQVQMNTTSDLDTLILDYHKLTNMRITVINRDGTVIAESDADRETMENHANRFEVMQAASQAYGKATRYSNTIKTDFLYVAKRIDYKGERITLRLAMSLEKIFQSYTTITGRLIFVFILFILIAITISYRLSHRIQNDINSLTDYLEEIGNKNYKAVIKTNHFSEFLLISLQLKNLVKKLSNRDKQKRKYTAKLRLINKQRNDILSAISHEFKNPVASIMGYAETLHDDPDVNIKIRTKFLDKILSNGKKIALMLDRLALSVKLENNDVTLHKSEFDLCLLADEVVQNLNKKYKDRSIHAECPPTLINADKTTIEMVLINLVDNAMKYSEADVTVTISDNRLNVIDRGIGIAAKEIEKISSKFYRVEKNTWDNSLGLGLAIVGYILNLHRTTLQIESEQGVGSTFWFDLTPLIKQD